MIHSPKIRLLFFLLLSTMLPSVAQVPNTLTPAEKIYGLSKFWQEVNYNFVYLDKIDKTKWDEAYQKLITTVAQTPNDYQYYLQLQRFCALLKDGHTNVNFPRSIEVMNSKFGDYRLMLQNIENKAIVVHVNASKKEEIPIGSEIIEVNGQPTAAYLSEQVIPYIASSTSYILQDWGIRDLLKGLVGDTYNVKIKKPNGKIIALALTHQPTREEAVYPEFDPPKGLLDFKWLPNGIAYLALNSFADTKIDSLFIQKLPELYKAKGLVIDLRDNTGGSTEIGTSILKYLTNDKVLYGSRSRSRLHIGTYKAWGGYIEPKDTVAGKKEWEFSKQDALKAYNIARGTYYDYFSYSPDTIRLAALRLVVPTVLLVGHNTASAAEDFLVAASNQKHMVRVGENSFGSTGQPLSFDLPGGGSARVCTKQDQYPDGRDFVGVGIVPDIAVKPTLKDYLARRDPALTRAIAYLKNKVK